MRRAAILLLLASTALAAEPDLRVEVQPDLRTTIVGKSTSLRSTLEDLCWRTGATLRFDDIDQPVAVTIENEPLEAALAHLLRNKSYFLTMRHDADGRVHVAALHVLGLQGATRRAEPPPAAPVAAPPPVVPQPLAVPQPLLEKAFGDDDADREPAIRELVEGIRNDPTRLQTFLEADPSSIANVLRNFPEAAEVIEKIRDTTSAESDIRAKLDALLAVLHDE